MKIGDLVNYLVGCDMFLKNGVLANHDAHPCLIVDIDDSHRQRSLKLLAQDGTILEKVWVGHVEVLSESG